MSKGLAETGFSRARYSDFLFHTISESEKVFILVFYGNFSVTGKNLPIQKEKLLISKILTVMDLGPVRLQAPTQLTSIDKLTLSKSSRFDQFGAWNNGDSLLWARSWIYHLPVKNRARTEIAPVASYWASIRPIQL